ncbi:MAG: FeoB-associated Cys-rich membrane protein [Clostridiales Family XIII bacterium]|nr:FeoB-associated Cys-rich membrane protein [Clostridiales Family XIII bacterium]
MNTGILWTIIIAAAIAFWIAMAVRSMWKARKRGGCSAGCSGCSGCAACADSEANHELSLKTEEGP